MPKYKYLFNTNITVYQLAILFFLAQSGNYAFSSSGIIVSLLFG